MNQKATATYLAIKRREAAKAFDPATATKAELIAAAEEAGVEVKAADTKADIAAKLADGAEG